MNEVGVVYALKNSKTNQFYIGSATKFVVRKRNHLSLLRRNKHHNPILQRSYNKYGLDVFEFSLLETNISNNLLLQREQYWIDTLKPHFNVLQVAGTHLGAKRTDETKNKISQALIGKRLSEEHKEKVRKANIGKKHKQETKQKMKESQLSRWSKFSRCIAQVDVNTGEIIKIFPNPSSAEKFLNLYRGKISDVLRGARKTTGGYGWRLYNE